MDVETFLRETGGSIAHLMSRELPDLDVMKAQKTVWIQFKVEVEDGDKNVVRVNADDKVFNSQMTEVFQGRDLNEIIDKMFTHMKMQMENLALVNSRFTLD